MVCRREKLINNALADEKISYRAVKVAEQVNKLNKTVVQTAKTHQYRLYSYFSGHS